MSLCGHHNKNGISGTDCQCDGNCQCGQVLPGGVVSCHNCGWKAPLAYSTIRDKFVCPSCRTESPFSISNVKPSNNNKMENSGFPSQGLVALGTGLPGGLWGVSMAKNPNPIGNESSFAEDVSQQAVVGYGIGQEWVPLFPGTGGESGYTFGEKLKSAFTRFTPHGILVRDSFCGKYCKALGYMRTADKNAFKRCKAACKVNYINARNGKWKYPTAPEGAESAVSPEELAAMSEKEAGSMSAAQKNAAIQNAANEDASDAAVARGAGAPKTNMMMWIIVGVVILAIIIALILIFRKRQQSA